MFSKGFNAPTCVNPYAVDVIRAKRRDLVYGISRTEDLLGLLVTEGVMTPAKRSIVLTFGTRRDQNSRLLDHLEAAGERACRIFFHPCLMQAEPDLYRRIKTYAGGVNERIRDARRQLIGYLLERDRAGMEDTSGTEKTRPPSGAEGTTTSRRPEREDMSRPLVTSEEHQPARRKPESLIHAMASDGDVVRLEELLEDADINSVNSSNETLLHVAAERGHLSVIELLIRKGAQLDLQDNEGHTALHRAASGGHAEAARAPVYALDPRGKTAAQLAKDNGHPGCVEVLVEAEAKRSESRAVGGGPRPAQALLQSGAGGSREKSALFCAVSRNDEKAVTVLLNAGAEVDRDVLHEAVRLDAESVLRLLLENPRGAVSEEALGSALVSAVKQNHDGAVTALLDRGADVNQCDQQGYTPLLWSAELGHAEVFRVLVANQAKLDATLPDLSSTLHLAVCSGSEPIVQTLLEAGLDPNITGPKAQTALHLAAQGNRPELVGLLLRAGAQVDAVAQDGLTPLHVASQQGHADPVIQLLQAKADPGVRDRLGRTALHWAASSRGGGRAVDSLLSAKANPNATDGEKKVALHLAATEGSVAAVTSLLSHKANGGAKDMDGATALHCAAAAGHAGVVSSILRFTKNKGMEERNAWRRTPLHVAAERGHGGVAALLLEAGAKVNSTDHSKDTPLHCAARGGHREVARMLVNWGQAGHVGRGGKTKVNLRATNNVGKTPLQVAESGDSPDHEGVATFLMRKMFLIK